MKKKVIIYSSLFALMTSCAKEAPKETGPAKLPVIQVEEKNFVGYDSYPAQLQGIVNNDVRAKIQGYITQVLVDEGQYVTKGQPLFRLETNVLTETADAARSGISAAKASYSASEANVAAAKAAVNAAQVEVNKLKPLVQKNIISNVQLETANANLAKAQAQYQQAVASQQQASAGISQANANYKGAQASVDYSIVRAPISGVVGSLPLKVGSLVGPTDTTALTTISDTREVYAYFAMNEKEYLNFLEKAKGATVAEKIKNLPMVELQLANGSIYGEKGRVETVTGQVNANTGTVQFRVAFPNAQKLLSNGNSGDVKIPVNYDHVLAVPESATFDQQGLVYVYKVVNNTAKNTMIKVKTRLDNVAIVESGLNKGDLVIATGTQSVANDAKIVPQKVQFDSLVQSIKTIF